MTLLQCLDSGGNVTAVLILYSRTNILPLLNQCSTAGLLQLLSFHSGYSCLENPRDGGAWWAATYGVANSEIGSRMPCSVDSVEVG